MTKKKIIIIIVCAAAALALIIGGCVLGVYLKNVNDYKKSVAAIVIPDVDISALPDGLYRGGQDVGFIRVRVEVSVKDGRITRIVLLEHYNDRGEAAEDITEEIIRLQSLKVDTVSGATNSSKTILKAIANALSAPPAEQRRAA